MGVDDSADDDEAASGPSAPWRLATSATSSESTESGPAVLHLATLKKSDMIMMSVNVADAIKSGSIGVESISNNGGS